MRQRTGTTLIEVLVAIFVMGLGLIALLTLFPIGAIRFAQAIHDDRCALSGQNAFSIAIAQNVCSDPSVVTIQQDLDDPQKLPVNDVFANPSARPGAFVNADPYGASYAVWVDPLGYNAVPQGPPSKDWVGGVRILRRRPVAFVNPANTLPPVTVNQNIYQSFTLLDDINFNSTENPGTPQLPPATTRIFRDSRFSWSYLLRRRQTSQVSAVDCTVVVFDNRPLTLSSAAGGPNAAIGGLALKENVYGGGSNPSNVPKHPSYFDPARSIITIDYTATGIVPSILPGGWILDASIVNPTATTATQHAYFYRVVGVLDPLVVGGLNLAQYEVQNQLRDWVQPPNPPFTNPPYLPLKTDTSTGLNLGFIGTAIVIDGIAEVIEKGPATPAP